MLPAFLTTIFFSISAVCATRTAKLMGGTEANFWRLLFAAVLLAIWSHAFGVGLTGSALPWFFLSGCVGFGVGDLALFQALPRIGSRLTVLLVQCLAAPFAAFIEWLWLGTTLSLAQLFCGLTILAGVSLALSPSRHLNLEPKQFLPGILFGVLAAFGQGFGAVLSRKAYEIAAQNGQSLDGLNAAYQRILGGVLIAGAFLLYVRWQRSLKNAKDAPPQWRAAWLWIILNGLSGPALGVGCYQWALKTTPTGVVLPIVAITPLVVIPFARAMEGERFNARSLLGGLIAVGGAVALTLVS